MGGTLDVAALGRGVDATAGGGAFGEASAFRPGAGRGDGQGMHLDETLVILPAAADAILSGDGVARIGYGTAGRPMSVLASRALPVELLEVTLGGVGAC